MLFGSSRYSWLSARLPLPPQFWPDLIIMTTDGPDGFLDGLRGTTSEKVLSRARCPVANLPVGSMLG